MKNEIARKSQDELLADIKSGKQQPNCPEHPWYEGGLLPKHEIPCSACNNIWDAGQMKMLYEMPLHSTAKI